VELFSTSRESKMGGWSETANRYKEMQESKMEENNDSLVKSTIVGVAPKLLRLGLVVAGIAFLISRLQRN